MKKILVAATAAAALCGAPALAADMPVKSPYAPVFNWAGWYIGLNAGGHWAGDNDPAFVSFNNNWIPSAVNFLNQEAPVKLDPSGFAGGIHAGYNWQMSNALFGIEADIDGLSGTKTRNISGPLGGPGGDQVQFIDSASDRLMSTLRARLGWTADRLLIFVSGGVALSDWSLKHTFNCCGPGRQFGTDNRTILRVGPTVGGGMEYALNDFWLVRVEYLYANFGKTNSNLNDPDGGGPGLLTVFTEPEKLSENIVRFGVTYKFSSH